MTSLLDQPTTIRPGEELDTTKLEAYLRNHVEPRRELFRCGNIQAATPT